MTRDKRYGSEHDVTPSAELAAMEPLAASLLQAHGVSVR